MIKTVLIDLDDTLLDTNIGQFLPAYLERLAGALSDYGQPDEIIQHLYWATQAMLENLDPTRTLKAAFDGRFYPALGTTEDELQNRIDRFYRETFPQLQELTHPIAEADKFVQQLAAAGYQVVIATNPLFPRTAIAQRIGWSDIDADDSSIQLITSYENFHFAKPKPAYFAEILGWLGFTAQEAVMIGDDQGNDLDPAKVLGIDTYKISHEQGHPGLVLGQARQWLDDRPTERSVELDLNPSAVLARMRGNLAALHQRAGALSAEEWRAQPGKRAWSPLEILCHLRDTEIEVNYPRISTMLTETTPFISAANPDEWASERNYLQQDPAQALAEFSNARRQTIARLTSLAPEQWRIPARHALLGPTTLAEVLTVAADHDFLHLKQLRQTLQDISTP